MVDLNASAAARRAGYSEKTANRQAAENLSKPVIQEAIAKRREELAKNTITPEDIVRQWAQQANTDIKDFLSWKTIYGIVGYTKEGEPVYDYRPVIDLKDSDEVDGKLVQEVSINEKGVFKFKLVDKQKALENAAKHLGMFIEKSEVSLGSKEGGPIRIMFVSPSEVEEEDDKDS